MNVWTSLRRLFDAKTETPPDVPAPPALRNKPGGMAWIKGVQGSGSEQLNGRAVRTVQLDPLERDIWIIDPPQPWICTQDTRWLNTGQFTWRGESLRTIGLADSLLEPWRDLGNDAQDESLWHPSPRIGDALIAEGRVILPLPVREMGRA